MSANQADKSLRGGAQQHQAFAAGHATPAATAVSAINGTVHGIKAQNALTGALTLACFACYNS